MLRLRGLIEVKRSMSVSNPMERRKAQLMCNLASCGTGVNVHVKVAHSRPRTAQATWTFWKRRAIVTPLYMWLLWKTGPRCRQMWEDSDVLRLLCILLFPFCLWLAWGQLLSHPRSSCRRKCDLFMRVKKGRIVTNCANTKNFKKANKKVIQFASPHVLTLIIPSSEFAGMNFQEHSLEKLIRKYGKACMESEFQKSVLCYCSWFSFICLSKGQRHLMWPLKVSS